MRWLALVALVAVLVLGPAGVLADAPGAARPAAPAPIDVDGDGRPDPVARLEEAEVSGRHLVLVTTARPPGEAALLAERRADGLVPLWRGPLGARDVDGEAALVLDLPALALHETRPEATDCAGRPLLLYPRTFDLAAARWVPAPPAPPPAAPTLRAGTKPPPGVTARTRPTVLRFVVATTAAGDGGSAGELAAPRELDDGRLDTAWVSHPGRAVGARFVARGQDARVLALRIVPGDGRSARAFAAGERATRLVWRLGDRELLVELPTQAGPDPVYAILPEPISASCVEIEVAATTGRGGALRLAELAVLTEVDADGPEGALALARAVALGGPAGAQAEHLLLGLGPRGASALVAIAGASRAPAELARLREALARTGEPAGAEQVAAGLRGADAAARERLAHALAGLAAAAVAPCARLLGDAQAPPAARVAAAGVLGGVAGAEARAALAGATGAPTGDEAAVRRAVIVALARQAAPGVLADLAGRTVSEPAAADLWRAAGLAAHRGTDAERAEVGRVAAERLGAGPGYELRHRLLQAVAAATPALLPRLLAAEPEPALRGVALEVLPAGQEAVPALAAGLADPDPGVRAAALVRSAELGAEAPAVVPTLLAGDPWPLVRRAAADALAASCGAGAPLLAAVRTDHDEGVRRAALAGLVRCREAGVGAELVALAGDAGASPGLRAHAAALLGALGDRALVPAVVALLAAARADTLAAPDAVATDGPVQRASAAAHALGQLGDPRATDALLAAAADPESPALQASALQALGVLCPSIGASGAADVRELLAAAAASDDALVAGAAGAARRRCPAVAGAHAP